MKETKIFKIRDKATELYSKGGIGPSWSKTGKTWNSIGALKNHLLQFTGTQFISGNIQWNEGIASRSKEDSDTVVHGNDGMIYHVRVPDTWEIVEIVVTQTVVGTSLALGKIVQTLLTRK